MFSRDNGVGYILGFCFFEIIPHDFYNFLSPAQIIRVQRSPLCWMSLWARISVIGDIVALPASPLVLDDGLVSRDLMQLFPTWCCEVDPGESILSLLTSSDISDGMLPAVWRKYLVMWVHHVKTDWYSASPAPCSLCIPISPPSFPTKSNFVSPLCSILSLKILVPFK